MGGSNNADFPVTRSWPAIAAGTAILYACLGEILCERAGVLNLGVEGMMLMGALGGVATAYWTGSAWLGALGAMLVGGGLSLIHAVADDFAARAIRWSAVWR